MLRPLTPAFIRSLAALFGLLLAVLVPAPAQAAINIMPLGDSITQGGKSGIGSVYYASYRYALYFKLQSAGYAVNMVGSLNVTSPTTPTPSATNYPLYATSFDRDHEGHFGKTTAYLNSNPNSNITTWLAGLPAADKPDLVVLNIGTNDANNIPTSTFISQLTSVIAKLRAANPSVKIVLSNIMVFLNHETACIDFNAALAQLAPSLSTAASPIVLADINTNLPTNARYDGIHPNLVGEEHLATVYFAAIQSLLGPAFSFTVDKIFGPNMVLQRSQPINVWGTGAPGATVTVALRNGATTLTSGTGQVNGTGQWIVTLPAVNTFGGPFVLSIASGTQTITHDNVLVGDVWLCSGQSNMDLTVKENNANTAFTALNPATDDLIRHFSVEHLYNAAPQETLGDRADETGNQWQSTAVPAVDGFTASGFFFARSYRAANPGVPIGIIKAAWGSTLIESWLSAETQASRPDLAARAAVIAADPANAPDVQGTRQRQPAVCYNGMIYPLRRFALRGFLWYQGESNANAAGVLTYPITQRLLIQSWRTLWGGTARPWVTVQLPGFAHTGEPIYWPWLRDAQTTTLQEPSTAVLGSIDLGSSLTDLGDADRELHPRTKVELGRRLATLVRAKFDGATGLVSEGPAPLGVELASPGVLRVSFDMKGSAALTTTGNAAPTGLEVAGSDGVYYPATTTVLESSSSIRVASTSVPAPLYVRYAMSNLFTGNLFNAESQPLPVLPFRMEPPVLGPVNFALSATPTPGLVSLTWNFPVGTTRFEVKRATRSGGPYTTLASPVTCSYTDSTVVAGTIYYYLITAKNDTGSSWNSTELVTASDLTLIKDNADASGVTFTGAWNSSTNPDAYLNSYIHDNNTGKGTKGATFTPTLPSDGDYYVYAHWVAAPNRATNVPIDIVTASGTSTVTVNQQLNGSAWNLLGCYTFSASTASVTIRTTGTNGYVVADAVSLVHVSGFAVDNTDAPVTIVGTWSSSTGTPGYLGSNYVHDGNTGKGTKSFSFKPVLSAIGNYRVYARWPAEINRATNVPVDIVTSSGAVKTVTVNQQTNSNTWNLLGTYTLAPANAEVKFRTAGTNGYVIADGVRVIPIPAVMYSSPFGSWRAQFFSLTEMNDPSISSDLTDPDGDGVMNIFEYGLGGDPLNPDASVLPRVSTNAGRLTLSFQRDTNLYDLIYTVQATSTLDMPNSWIDIASGTNGAALTPLVTDTLTSETPGAGTLKNVEVRDSLPPTQATRRFLRLKISR
ncbi:MAG: sialate O-acetylesterase [Chthoniobacterales bacterium]